MKKSILSGHDRLAVFIVFVAILPLSTLLTATSVYAVGHSFAEATALAPGAEVSSTIVNGTTSDYYQINVLSRGNLTIRLRHEDDQEDQDWKVELLTSDVAHTLIRQFYHDTYYGLVTYRQEGLAAGTYYIRVSSRSQYSIPDAPYFLQATHFTSNYYEVWPNDSFSTANGISLGHDYEGNIATGTDYDYFQITVPSRGDLTIRLRNEDDQEDKDWNVELFTSDVSHTLIRQFYHDTYYGLSTYRQEGIAAGIYYIRVRSQSEYSIPGDQYFLQVDHTPSDYYEVWPNDSFSTANPISLGHDYEGNIATGTDYDYFRITLPSRGNLTIRLRHENDQENRDWRIELFTADVNHDLIRQFDHDTYYGLSASRQEGLAAGTYYVRVRSTSEYSIPKSQYFLQVDHTPSDYYEVWPNGGFSTATPMETGHDYEGNTATGDDHDYFLFTLQESAYVIFRLRHEDVQETRSWDFLLLSSTPEHNTLLEFEHSPYQGFVTTKSLLLEAGDYYVKVQSSSSYSFPKSQYFVGVFPVIKSQPNILWLTLPAILHASH